MSKLISGKEALIALANGVKPSEIEGKFAAGLGNSLYLSIDGKIDLCVNHLDEKLFRLKPRTITLNGIEVPACGENYKEGEDVYVFDDCCDERGYIEYSVSGHNFEGLLPKLWWRTEEEIKQVVEALRSVFKPQ